MKQSNHAARSRILRSAPWLMTAVLMAALGTGCGGGGGTGGGGDGSTPGIDKPWLPGSGTIWLSWTVPTERENGNALPLSELSGYRIYWGSTENPTENHLDVNEPTVTTYQISNVAPGDYVVSVAAVDSDGLESQPSNTLTKTIN